MQFQLYQWEKKYAEKCKKDDKRKEAENSKEAEKRKEAEKMKVSNFLVYLCIFNV